MAKSTATYWNALAQEHADKWEDIPGYEGQLRQLTLAMDAETGDYTRLTFFKAGTDTSATGAKSHSLS